MEVAIKNTNQAAMELLVEKGINLNARICYWGTPLQFAAKLWEKKTVSFLIEMGADVNACVPRAIFGSALEAAIISRGRIYSSRLQVIEMILSHGANPAAVRPVGNVPLLLGCIRIGRLRGCQIVDQLWRGTGHCRCSGHSLIFQLLHSRPRFALSTAPGRFPYRILQLSDVLMGPTAHLI